MNRIKFSRFIPAIIWFFVVLVLLCLPGSDLPSSDLFQVIYFDKWVHIGIFGLLALLFMLPVAFSPVKTTVKLQYFIIIFISSSAWGLTTEFIQKYLVVGRNFDLMDWAADSIGAFISFIFCLKKYAWSK